MMSVKDLVIGLDKIETLKKLLNQFQQQKKDADVEMRDTNMQIDLSSELKSMGYTYTLRKAVYTPNAFKLYRESRHGFEDSITRERINTFKKKYCQSPLLHKGNEPQKGGCLITYKPRYLDKNFHSADEIPKNYPVIKGAYFLYHIFNGKLIAISVLDILNKYVTR